MKNRKFFLKHLGYKIIIFIFICFCLFAGFKRFFISAPNIATMGQMPPASVDTMLLSKSTANIVFEYPGQVAAIKEIEIHSQVQGILQQRLYQEGKKIAKGEVLAIIDPKPYQAAYDLAKGQFAKEKANLEQAQHNYNRIALLKNTGAISKKQFDDSKSEFAAATASLAAAKAAMQAAEINLSYTKITAPIDGIIGRALKVEGSFVSNVTYNAQDSLIATMAQVDPAYINFNMPESEYINLKKELASNKIIMPKDGLLTGLKSSDGVILPNQGKIDFSDYKADPTTGSFALRSTVANKEGLLFPGQFVRVIIKGAQRPNTIIIPQRAVLDDANGKFVYVVAKNPQGKPIAALRPVKVGSWVLVNDNTEQGWIIEEGLDEGDNVVIDGMARIFYPNAPIEIKTTITHLKNINSNQDNATGKN